MPTEANLSRVIPAAASFVGEGKSVESRGYTGIESYQALLIRQACDGSKTRRDKRVTQLYERMDNQLSKTRMTESPRRNLSGLELQDT